MIWLFILQCGVFLWYLFKNVKRSFNSEEKVKSGDWLFLFVPLFFALMIPFAIETDSIYEDSVDLEDKMIFIDRDAVFIWDGETTNYIQNQEQVEVYLSGDYKIIKHVSMSWYNTRCVSTLKIVKP